MYEADDKGLVFEASSGQPVATRVDRSANLLLTDSDPMVIVLRLFHSNWAAVPGSVSADQVQQFALPPALARSVGIQLVKLAEAAERARGQESTH